MGMRTTRWIAWVLVGMLAACAQQPARDASTVPAPHDSTIDYARYVQGTVPWFHFTSLYCWDSNELGYVVVWTSPRQAYRLQLAGPCLGLRNTAGIIGLTSQDGLVDSNRDAVVAGGHHCGIMRIERLDAKSLRAAMSGPKSAGEPQD